MTIGNITAQLPRLGFGKEYVIFHMGAPLFDLATVASRTAFTASAAPVAAPIYAPQRPALHTAVLQTLLYQARTVKDERNTGFAAL